MTAVLRNQESGFSLIEALAALAIVAVLLGALAMVAAQWLPQWRHGFTALQRADEVAQSLDRLAADLSAAEYARLEPGAGPPLFRGGADRVIFVRAAMGPGASPRLVYVRISLVATKQGWETQRASAPFAPGAIGPFRDAVTVLRAPFRLSLAYQGPNGVWTSSWGASPTLPRAIRLMVKTGDALVASTAFSVKTTSGPDLSSPPLRLPDELQPAGADPK